MPQGDQQHARGVSNVAALKWARYARDLAVVLHRGPPPHGERVRAPTRCVLCDGPVPAGLPLASKEHPRSVLCITHALAEDGMGMSPAERTAKRANEILSAMPMPELSDTGRRMLAMLRNPKWGQK